MFDLCNRMIIGAIRPFQFFLEGPQKRIDIKGMLY